MAAEPSERDEGYFPPGSMLRRIQSERAVGLLFGERALTVGALAPRNFVGTAIHTQNMEKPWQRLSVTGRMFETVFFGTRAEADRVLGHVHRLHQRVKGTLPEDAGAHWPAGTPYSALGPAEMLWTIAVMFDSAETLYGLLVRPLTDTEREQFWQDYRRFAELWGTPREVLPATYADFRAYWAERMASDDLFLTEEAKLVGYHTSFAIPVPLHLRPGRAMINLLIRGSLPERIRQMYGLSWTPADEASFRAATAAIRTSRTKGPASYSKTLTTALTGLWRGDNTAFFDLIAESERRRFKRGKLSYPGFPVERFRHYKRQAAQGSTHAHG